MSQLDDFVKEYLDREIYIESLKREADFWRERFEREYISKHNLSVENQNIFHLYFSSIPYKFFSETILKSNIDCIETKFKKEES